MKIIIWGYPLHKHTHSYTHNAFYKAFKALGHEVYWFHDEEFPTDFNYDNCVFLTEGFADKNIPIKKSSTYYVHVCVNPAKYLGNVKKLIDVRYLQESMDNDNYEFVLDRSKCTELDSGVLYSNEPNDYDIVYTAWGTDLLPEEIDLNWADIERENTYYFIGSMSDGGRFANGHLIREFAEYCKGVNVNYVHISPWSNPVSDDENRKLIQKSFMSPDFRNDTHKRWGYIGCRLIKSISYGQMGMTNSEINAKFIDDSVIFKDNVHELFEEGLKHKDNRKIIKHQMEIVKSKHTFVHRAIGLLKLL